MTDIGRVAVRVPCGQSYKHAIQAPGLEHGCNGILLNYYQAGLDIDIDNEY